MAQEYPHVPSPESRSDGERVSESVHLPVVQSQPRPPGLAPMSVPASSEISGLEQEARNKALEDGYRTGVYDKKEHLRPTREEFKQRCQESALRYLAQDLPSEARRSIDFGQLIKIYESSYEQGYFHALERESLQEREAWFLSERPAIAVLRARQDKIADVRQDRKEKDSYALWSRGLRRAVADLLLQPQEGTEQYAERIEQYIALYSKTYSEYQPMQGAETASAADTSMHQPGGSFRSSV